MVRVMYDGKVILEGCVTKKMAFELLSRQENFDPEKLQILYQTDRIVKELNRLTKEFVNEQIKKNYPIFDDYLDAEVTALNPNAHDDIRQAAQVCNEYAYQIWQILHEKIKELSQSVFVEFDIDTFLDSLPKLEAANGN